MPSRRWRGFGIQSYHRAVAAGDPPPGHSAAAAAVPVGLSSGP